MLMSLTIIVNRNKKEKFNFFFDVKIRYCVVADWVVTIAGFCKLRKKKSVVITSNAKG